MIEQLRVFVYVAETESFSRAAELLFLTQPTVSQQIRSLEAELGVKLFERTPKYVRITEHGQILFKKAKLILQTFDKAIEELDQLNKVVAGTLKIGASYSIGETFLPRVMSYYAQQYPLVDLRMTVANTSEIINGVRNHLYDVVLISENIEFADLDIHQFMRDELVVIMPVQHPLRDKQNLQTDDLQNQIWVMREKGSGTRAFNDAILHELQIKPLRTYEFSSSQSVKEAVLTGLGVSIVSSWIAKKEESYGELLLRRIADKPMYRNFYVMQRKDRSNSRIQKSFIQFLKQFTDSGQL
jgi:DNA-binding transcriptional LysR family regulator